MGDNEQTIDELNIKINSEAKNGVSGIDKLAASIQKLRDVTGGGAGNLTGIAASFVKLNSAISDMKGKSGSVTSIVSSFQKLNNLNVDSVSNKIAALSKSLGALGNMDPSLKTIISDLAALARSGNGSAAENALKLQADAAKAQATIDKSALTSAKAQEGLKAIADRNAQIEKSARAAAARQKELTDAIEADKAKYSGGGTYQFPNDQIVLSGMEHVAPERNDEGDIPFNANNASVVSQNWKRLLSENAKSTSEAEKIMDAFYEKLPSEAGEASKVVSEVGNAAKESAEAISSGSSKASGFVDRLKQSFSGMKDQIEQTGTRSNSFFSMGRFYGWYFILQQAARTFGGFINNINSFIENQNLFSVAMGKSAQSGQQLANSLQGVLGIDSGEAMRYMGVFQQMETSFGITNKQATIMSENFTQLGYDLASFYNISTSDAFTKLQSGLAGQTRSLRTLGIDISNARLQQELYNQGINEKVKDLNEADKAELIYIAVMKQTTNAQGDMARTIITPANALRVLQAQLTITGRAIGSLFIPALLEILPPVTAVIEVIGDLASELASFLGFKMPKIDYSSLNTGLSGVADDADKAANSVGDIGKNAKEAKKQMNDLIGGFDELNILQQNNENADEGKSKKAGAGDIGSILGGINLPSYDALSGAMQNNIDAIKEKIEQYEPLIKEILKDVIAVGVAFLTWKLTSGLFNGLMNLIPPLKAYKGQFTEIAAGLTLVAGLFAFAYLHSENFRNGINELGKAFDFVGTKISEFVTGAAKSLGIKELTGEFWTSTAGIIVIAIGAIAIALGAPIFGTIAVVGGAAVLAIQAIGYAASDSIPKVNLFGDGISSATEKKVKPFIDEMNKLDETIKGIKWSGKIVTDSDIANVKDQVNTIVQTLVNGLDADKNQALKTLNPLKNALGNNAYDDIIKASGQYYDKQKLTVQQGETEINKIMQTAKDQHRGLKQSEYDEISKIENNMETTGIKNLSASQTESNLIFQRLKDNHTALSAQEASEIVKNSAKQRDQTISDAQKQYDGICTEAQKMYDAGAINKNQYDEIIQAATKSKNETIKQAQDQHSQIVNEAKIQAGDLSNQINWSTGDIKSKWTVFWDWYFATVNKNWGDFFNFFKQTLPDWFNNNIAPWFSWSKWSDLGNTAKNAVQNELGSIWVDFSGWWNDNVAPWFTWDKWSGLAQQAIDALIYPFQHISWPQINVPSPHVSYDSSGWGAGAFQWFGLPGVPQISWHATGGVFNSPSVIGVGEAGPEAVVPLSEDSPWIERLADNLNEKENDSGNEKNDATMYQMMRMAFVSALKEAGGDVNLTVNTNVDSEPVARKVYKIQKRDQRRFTTQPT